MRTIIIVGTIHLNWTPQAELEQALSELNPNKVFIELSENELAQPRKDSIRDEMFVSYDWAKQHNIPFTVFDVEHSGLKEGVTGTEPEFMEHELKCKELLKEYSWKDLNNVEPWQISEVAALEKEIEDKYFDTNKSKQRELAMLENINKELVDGVNVIITGAGHLTFFKDHIPEAVLPFRN
jgi:hypothetical protein